MCKWRSELVVVREPVGEANLGILTAQSRAQHNTYLL